jgi:hypothetical protein
MALPGTFTLQATLIAATIALVAGLAGGAYATHAFYAPRLEVAELKVKNLGDKVVEQNAAVERLKADAAERQRQAEARVAAAQAEALQHQARAQQLLMRKPPAGQTECQATEALFREVLRK